MASKEDLKGRQRDQDNRRHASRLSQEPANLIHKSAEEEPANLIRKSVEEELEEELRDLREKFEEERKARIKAEKENNELQSQLAERERLVTPMDKGTSVSGCKLLIASRVFRDQLIDIF